MQAFFLREDNKSIDLLGIMKVFHTFAAELALEEITKYYGKNEIIDCFWLVSVADIV